MAAAAHHNPDPRLLDSASVYTAALGFVSGLEFSARLVEGDAPAGGGLRDLSADLRYRFFEFDGGPGFAAGFQDYGGQTEFFRSRYLVASWPWRTLSATAGYGERGSALDGWFGGAQWTPVEHLSLLADATRHERMAGVRLSSGSWLGRLRLSLTASYAGERREADYGISLSLPLGREYRPRMPLATAPAPPADADLSQLASALAGAGFESVRVGTRPDGTVVSVVENRSYNHSDADAVGVALATAATHLPANQQLELVLTRYEVPQLAITLPMAAWNEFRHTGDATGFRQAWRVEAVDEVSGVRWQQARAPMRAIELIVEPILRTFIGTEAGAADYGLGARLGVVAPLAAGLLVTAGLQAPVARSDDLKGGGAYEFYAPEGGVDHALLQYFHKPLPSWSWLWSAGRTQVFRADLLVGALEQQWLSPAGRHQLRLKLMGLRTDEETLRLALGGYTWFDAPRRYSIGLTGGRFYAGDNGGRLDVSRYFGDTIVGFYWRVAGRHEQVAGVQLSLPLTPRRDMQPGVVQLKGARRWAWNLGTTVNDASGRNPLRPLLLYEPMLDLDLRRDFFDAGRLTPEFIESNTDRLLDAASLP